MGAKKVQNKCPISTRNPGTNFNTTWHFVLTLLVLFVLNCYRSLTSPSLTPVITLNDGQVQGKVAYSRDGKKFWQFLSIPYAEPPIGKLKFQPPVPVKPWAGLKVATTVVPSCIQFTSVLAHSVLGQEDCLYLNVYTPPIKNNTDSKLLPVLFHVHGGGNVMGTSNYYGPDYLMDHPIVVVTSNYRLGPFGFLNFNHDPKTDGVHLPRGNMGLKDQLLALKWVQNNIAQFGGDPKRVVLQGESAGGASVHFHVLSPKSRGLFYRAFSHSGTAFSSWGYTSRPREVTLDYARRMGCPANDTRALLNCIENFDPFKMVKYQLSSTDPALPKDNLSPSVEAVESEDRFLSEHPQDILDSGNFSKVPYIFAVNSGDGGLRTGGFEVYPSRVTMLQTNWTETIGNVLLIDNMSSSKALAIRNFYFPNLNNSYSVQEYKRNLTILFSDFFSFETSHRSAIGHANSGAEAYLMYFNYTSPMLPDPFSMTSAYNPNSWVNGKVQILWNTFSKWIQEKVLGYSTQRPYGVGHNEDVPQVWNFVGSKWLSGWDTEFSKAYVKMLVQFVEGRTPPAFQGTIWPKVKISQQNTANKSPLTYMLVENSKTGKLIAEPFAERMQFLDSIGVKNFNR